MKRTTRIAALATVLLTASIVGLTIAEVRAADTIRTLEVGADTPRLEVRYSQIGFRDTLLFYTFTEQNAVLKLQFGNKDKTFPVKGTLYFFADTTTEEGLKKWLNNQHSDGLFPDVPEPISLHKLPADICKVTSHKLIDRSKQAFGEYDNYAVIFKVIAYADMKSVKLKEFSGETKVHVKSH